MKYKVLHCLSFMNRGGAETFIMNILRNIDRTKYCFDFLLQSSEGHYIDEIKELGGKIYTIPLRSNGLINYCNSLNRFFAEHQNEYDAVHEHTSSLSSIEVLYYAKKWGVKKRILHSHNTNQAGLFHHFLHYINKPIVRYLATDYLACSEVARIWLFKYTGILSKSHVVNNGIDTSLFEYSDSKRFKIRTELGISSDTFVIGHVGRFDVVKNHTFLIKIFNEILFRRSDSLLLLVGGGELMDDIVDEAKSLKINGNVKFLGVRGDIDKLLSAFDVFVFPSLYEGLPVSLVEAQASGLPVFVSNNVSPEVKLSENLKFLSLDEGPAFWAEQISCLPKTDREKNGKCVEEKGYSIFNTVKFLINEIYV